MIVVCCLASLLTVYMCFTMTLRCQYRLEHAPNAELMAAFSREANNKLREFAPQNISNMLWAYATLGHSPGTLIAFWSTTQCHLDVVPDAHAKLALADVNCFVQALRLIMLSKLCHCTYTVYIYPVLYCRCSFAERCHVCRHDTAEGLHPPGHQGHPVGLCHPRIHPQQPLPARLSGPVPCPHRPVQPPKHS